MSERFRYEPIMEPTVPPPILEPSFFPEEPAEFILTQKQREAILERDGQRCQATVRHQHSRALEVDHIIPQRYGQTIGLDEETLDQPENLLTKCTNAHDLKHRDRIVAKEKYRGGNKSSYGEMFIERNERLQHGEIYWNADNDRTDMVQALKKTQQAKKRGWVYPQKNRRQ